jgi:secondary thiamine-phosphate synthase enzyme
MFLLRKGGGEMKSFTVRTTGRTEMIDITSRIRAAVKESRIKNGICQVFVPHTTAAVTINENDDPDVPRDILMGLNKLIPFDDPQYIHSERNSDAHIKTSLIGSSEMVIIENSNLVLGTWQAVFFCEFDGPRTRKVLLKILSCE